MTEAWATWTASLPRDSSRSERTAMTSLYSMRSPVSVQLRGPFLFELPQLRLDRLQLHAGAVPDLFVMGPPPPDCHPHRRSAFLIAGPRLSPFSAGPRRFQRTRWARRPFGRRPAGPRPRDPRGAGGR